MSEQCTVLKFKSSLSSKYFSEKYCTVASLFIFTSICLCEISPAWSEPKVCYCTYILIAENIILFQYSNTVFNSHVRLSVRLSISYSIICFLHLICKVGTRAFKMISSSRYQNIFRRYYLLISTHKYMQIMEFQAVLIQIWTGKKYRVPPDFEKPVFTMVIFLHNESEFSPQRKIIL